MKKKYCISNKYVFLKIKLWRMIFMAIPVAPIGRIIKDAGAERVSEEAKKELNAYVEAQAAKVAKKAIKFAELAKRKTVKAEDIELAINEL